MILAAKAMLVLAAFLATWPLLAFAGRGDVSTRRYDQTLFGLLAISRLGLFVVIFVILGMAPQSDVTFYFAEALAVRSGGTPLVSIDTAYGPAFDYLVAAALWIWRDNRMLVLLTIAAELASFPLWMKVGRAAFAEGETRRAGALYVANPLALATAAIAGQNHVWLSLLLALSLLALAREAALASGLWLGLSIVAVKFLSLLFAPILLLATRRRAIWSAAFVAPPLIGYGAVMALGAQPWRQVMFHALHASSGNLPFLLSAFGVNFAAPQARLTADAVAFLALCALFLLALRRFERPRGARAIAMCAFVLIVTLVAQEKAFTSYLVVALFPLCLALAAARQRTGATILLLAVSGLATLEPSLWFRWLEQNDLSIVFLAPAPEGLSRWRTIAFLACDTALVGGYLALLAALWRVMADLREAENATATSEQNLSPSVPSSVSSSVPSSVIAIRLRRGLT